MKRKILLLVLPVVMVIFCHCTNSSGDAAENVEPGQQAIKDPPVFLFDSLEHLFGNENWQMIDGIDTSYLLFSRQNSSHINVYHYKMSQGDSVNSITSEIGFRGDSVVWSQPTKQLVLINARGKEIEWKDNSLSETAHISFRQTEKDKIVFQRASQKIDLVKTITLSDFLVRSRYDFIHGTHYASDTTSFRWKKLKKG